MEIKLTREAVPEELFTLLKSLMNDSSLADFYLVGGTALALHLGHRKSVDIDLFTNGCFNSLRLSMKLSDRYALTEVIHEENTLRCFINGAKLDFITHSFPLIEDVIEVNQIRLLGLKDLSAMKLNAVAGRGSRKDFWDIAALLNLFSIEEMFSCFKLKYPQGSTWHLLRSLSFFEDADNESVEIDDLSGLSWSQVKEKIRSHLIRL